MAEEARIAVVEDQRFTREATVGLLSEHYGSRYVVDGFAAVEDVLSAGVERYVLVVLDLQLREGMLEGRDAVRALARHTTVLVFSGLESGEALTRAQAAGAMGYVSKDTA